jgi:hypothetical protein
MSRLISHLRHNLVAYLALFVALGGTSYAAVSLPAGSVGTRQLRNGSVTRVKLNGTQFAGYVHAWAYVSAAGRIIVARGFERRVQVVAGYAGGSYTVSYLLSLKRREGGCVALASLAEPALGEGPQSGSTPARVYSNGEGVGVSTYNDSDQGARQPFVVEVLC